MIQKLFRIGLCAVLITGVCAGAAYAQDDVDPTLSAGGFIFKSTVSVSEEYDGNKYTEHSNPDGDFITRLKPEVLIKKTAIGKNSLELRAGAEQTIYADDSDDDYLNYHADIKTKYVFAPLTALDASAEYQHLYSRRGDNDADPAAVAAEPMALDRLHSRAEVTRKIAQTTLAPRLEYTHLDYDDGRRQNGTIIDQDVRDRNDYTAGGRVTLDMPDPHVKIYVDGDFTARNYDQNITGDRDSKGGAALAGFTYRPGRQFLVDFAAGYMRRDYDDGAFNDIGAWDADARMEWTYAKNSTVRFAAGRDIAEVTDGGVGGAVRTNLSVLLRQQIVPGTAGKIEMRFVNSNYQGGNGSDSGIEDRRDQYYKASIGIDHYLTGNVMLTADYSYARRMSNLSIAEFDDNVILLGVRTGF